MGQTTSIPLIVVLVVSVISTIMDVWRFRVYNCITIPLLLSGLAYNSAVGGLSGLGESLIGVLFGFLILIGFYLLGGFGSGDVKLVMAIGAWLGMPMTLYVVLASALASGLYALVLIAVNDRFRDTWMSLKIIGHRVAIFGRYLAVEERVESVAGQADRRGRLIPFAAMLALGTIALFVMAWMGAWG